jgi:hypothetical protein
MKKMIIENYTHDDEGDQEDDEDDSTSQSMLAENNTQDQAPDAVEVQVAALKPPKQTWINYQKNKLLDRFESISQDVV